VGTYKVYAENRIDSFLPLVLYVFHGKNELVWLTNPVGILILTSNRVGTFDEAFKSRLNVVWHIRI
jgi:hypothetical protein